MSVLMDMFLFCFALPGFIFRGSAGLDFGQRIVRPDNVVSSILNVAWHRSQVISTRAIKSSKT